MISAGPVTVSKARRAARSVLSAQFDTAALDADILLSEALSVNRNMLDLLDATELDASQQAQLSELLKRRLAGEPIAYITESKAFWSIEVKVSTATLVPRPETELVVERALFHARANARPVIADLGTGTGCIALALAAELGNARIVAVDLSVEALDIARQNCASLGLDNVEFLQSDWTDGLPRQHFDIIVANPPYIADNDPCLDDPAMQYEPDIALLGGADGLQSVRRIVTGIQDVLAADGWLIIEHGFDQGASVRQLFEACQLTDCKTYKDLAGLDRVTEGRCTQAAPIQS